MSSGQIYSRGERQKQYSFLGGGGGFKVRKKNLES